MEHKNNIKKNFLKIILYFFSLLSFFIGVFFKNENISLVAVMMIFVINIGSALYKKKNGYTLYILFLGFIFLFILSRPLISFFRNDVWWYFPPYTIYTSLFILWLSLFFLDLGFNKADKYNYNVNIINLSDNQVDSLRKYLFIITLFLLIITFIREIINMIYFYGNYVSIYTGERADIPFVIDKLANLSIYFTIIYLSLLPNKRNSIIILLFFVITGIPGYVIGGRNALMIKGLFAFLYFILRECLSHKRKWLGKREIIVLVVLIPMMMIALGIKNYTRTDEKIPTMNPIQLSIDFLYKQGTSYDTLCQTIQYRNELRNDDYISYTFGEPIDFVVHNAISNLLFNTEELNGNSIANGTISNNLAHRISYLVLGDQYLDGHGRGTTYFSEIYLDFGYLGIALFNFILGCFFKKTPSLFKKNIFYRIVLLNIFMYIYMIPRLATFSIFSFVLNYYFWISFICFWLLIKFVERRIG